jgi:hypothetical protein
MPLPTNHPFVVESPAFYTNGSLQTGNAFVQRGLTNYVSANTWSFREQLISNQVVGTNRDGTGFRTGVDMVRNTFTPGGLMAIDPQYVDTFSVTRAPGFGEVEGSRGFSNQTFDIWFMRKSWITRRLFFESHFIPLSGMTEYRRGAYFSNSTIIVDNFYASSGGVIRLSNTGLIANGVWHNVCITWSPTTITAYLDGVSFGSRTLAHPGSVGTPGLRSVLGVGPTGMTGENVNFHQTVVSTIKIYNVVLDASEVRQNYNALAEAHGRLPIA